MHWLRRLIGRTRLERDLERELAFHLEAHTRDLMRSGLSRRAAARQARLQLGGVEQVKEAARDVRGLRWLEDWWYDARLALRSMARAPVFTMAAVLTLALGIGANTAVWSIIDALLMRALPIAQPEQLHAVKKDGSGNDLLSFARFRQLQEVLDGAVPLAAMSVLARAYGTIGDQPESLTMQLVSGEWFGLLGVGAQRGRVLGPQDAEKLGGHPVAVISEAYWDRVFGRDPNILGRSLRINGAVLTVIGVAQPGFAGLTVGQTVDVWVPAMMQHEVKYKSDSYAHNSDSEAPWIPQDGLHWLTLIARVPTADAPRIAAVLDRRFRIELEREMADFDESTRAQELRQHLVLTSITRGFSPLRDFFAEGLRALMITVALVLLIACGNLAGLLLARNAARTHEFAIRVSLGARAGRLVRQVFTECMALAFIGGALGLLVAYWGSRALLRAASSGPRPIPLDVGLDMRVLMFAFVVTLATGALFSLTTAWRVARGNSYEVFKSGDRVRGGRGSHRLPLGRVLVVSQIALSLVLVVSAGLFVNTFRNLTLLDPGYEADRIINARVDVRAAGYEHDELPALYQQLLERIGAAPGVRSVSLSLNGLSGGGRRFSSFQVPGRSFEPGDNQAQENYVTPAYFATTGITLLRGRSFSASDHADAPRVAIVSEAMAKHFFGTDDPVGSRIGYGTQAKFEVVGVVRDARVNQLREAPPRLIFYPLAQEPEEYITSVEARAVRSAEASIADVRSAIAAVDRNLPVREVIVLRELVQRGLWRERLIARLAGGFGVIALLLAAIGLYGVVAYMVSRRTNEIGVRLALGARPADVRRMMLRDSLVTVTAGITLGLALSLPLAGIARNLLFGLSPRDPATTVAAVLVTGLVGLVAGFVPSWRASRIDPLRAIRAE